MTKVRELLTVYLVTLFYIATVQAKYDQPSDLGSFSLRGISQASMSATASGY